MDAFRSHNYERVTVNQVREKRSGNIVVIIQLGQLRTRTGVLTLHEQILVWIFVDGRECPFRSTPDVAAILVRVAAWTGRGVR